MRGLFVLALCACGTGARQTTDAPLYSSDAPTECTSSNSSSISGKVFAPNGTLPLYGIRVYVPQQMPPPLTAGVQCLRCTSDLPGGAITSTTTGVNGSFELDGVPAGDNIPVILTTGKWRRTMIVPTVGACARVTIPDGQFRLPRNRSEGEMPRIAQVTGGCDGLACVLSKLGIDASEFGASSSGPQAVTFYNGVGGVAPGAPQPAEALWGNLDELKKFDLVINSCECAEHDENKTDPDLLRQYADLGGRVYGSHFQVTWTKDLVPPWQPTATWDDSADPTTGPALVDTSFPEGNALASWLVAVGASTTFGEVPLGETIPNATAVAAPSKRWLYSPGAPGITHYLSFQTPVGVDPTEQCGKVVYAGLHVSSGSVTSSFPSACTTSFTPDEMALVYLLFDLQACDQIIF
jgi:hypothetical protein